MLICFGCLVINVKKSAEIIQERTLCVAQEELYKATDRKETIDTEQRGAENLSLVTERLTK